MGSPNINNDSIIESGSNVADQSEPNEKYISKFGSKEILRQAISGATVAMAMIPEAVAFALVAGVQPEVGLHAAWIMCLVTGLLGGRSGMISGATGSTAVVMGPIVASYGVGHLYYAVILSGIMELVFGLCRIHSMLKFVTLPVKIGFLNALAIVIFDAQKHSFYKPKDHSVEQTDLEHEWITGTALWLMIALTVIALVINLLPCKKLQRLPLALISIIICTGLEWGLIRRSKFKTILVQDVDDLSSGLPAPIFLRESSFKMIDNNARTVLPALDEWGTWKEILPLAFFLAMIGMAESLMTLEAIDAILHVDTDGKTNDGMNRGFLSSIKKLFLNDPREPASAQTEVLAQGTGNILSGLFGSMGGCAMIGQSMINVHNGGDKRLSSVFAGIFTLLVILSLSPIIGIVPLGSLVGVMICVSYHTFEFSSLGWMLNSVFGGGRICFGLVKSDGCVSNFFYGDEEESAKDSVNNVVSTSAHLEVTNFSGKATNCQETTDEEAEIINSDVITDGVARQGGPEHYALKIRGTTVDETEQTTSSLKISSKPSVLEASNAIKKTSIEQKLSYPICQEAADGDAAQEGPEHYSVIMRGTTVDEVQQIPSSIKSSSKPPISEVSNAMEKTSLDEKLSDLNIMDTLVIVATIVLTIKTNLAIAVLAGGFASNLERWIRNKYVSKFACGEIEMSRTGTTKMEQNKR